MKNEETSPVESADHDPGVQGRDPKGRKPMVAVTEEIMTRICEEISVGNSLDAVCASSPDFPSSRAIRLHVVRNPAAAAQLHEARRQQISWHVDELIAICDDPTTDPRRAKNAFNARTWLLEKLIPIAYGPSSKLTIDGAAANRDAIRAQLEMEMVHEVAPIIQEIAGLDVWQRILDEMRVRRAKRVESASPTTTA